MPDGFISTALAQVAAPEVLLIILLSALYGLAVGAIPGLTATMAVALMVPLTFYLSDVQAIAAIVTTVTCSIFAGDLPATLVRIPGTPASAAYADDAYALASRGQAVSALRTSLMFSVCGGLLGTLVLACAAPPLAGLAKQFTSYEYFWLYALGLTCAMAVSAESRLKGAAALLIGLLLSSVGLGTDFSTPRLTFGIDELINGVSFIPAMIGLFGISEVLRNVATVKGARNEVKTQPRLPDVEASRGLMGGLNLWWARKLSAVRSSVIGSVIGMLPGAGADIAAWISYGVSKRFARRPEEYGKGSLEGLADATGANNAALGGAWIPALVFGIPGDSATAIALGVLLMKNITPGPDIFDASQSPGQASLVIAIYATFVIANLILIPLGWLAIKGGSRLMQVPSTILMPLIVLFCIVGSYSMSSNSFDIWVMFLMGLLGFALERVKIPLGRIVLGLIIGAPLEHRFLQSLATANSWTAFFDRPVALLLALICGFLWLQPLLAAAVGRGRSAA